MYAVCPTGPRYTAPPQSDFSHTPRAGARPGESQGTPATVSRRPSPSRSPEAWLTTFTGAPAHCSGKWAAVGSGAPGVTSPEGSVTVAVAEASECGTRVPAPIAAASAA